MTIDEDRAEIERVAVSWQDVPPTEQEAMLTRLGKMLEYLVRCVVSSLTVGFGTIMYASSGPFVAIRRSAAVDGMDAFVVDPSWFGAAGEDHFVGS